MPIAVNTSNFQIGSHVLHYEILEELGAGGMGVTYKAFDTVLKRTVALKTLHTEVASDATSAGRLLIREAQAAAALTHPNICVVYAIERCDDVDFIVMEHVRGQSLAEVLASGPMAPGRVATVAMQAADALRSAHGSGVLHRDIKPSNIMLTEDGQAKILDFGLAKRMDPGEEAALTHSLSGVLEPGRVIGTLPYMSPEQLTGEPLDGRSDLFALGVVLYELCSGRHPFLHATAVSTMARILNRDPDPLAEIAAGVPRGLERIIMRCLAKAPSDRFESAQQLLGELRSLAPDPLWRARIVRSSGPSVAVLPFVSSGAQPAEDYLIDGVTSELISRLSRSRDLVVIAERSSMRYKDTELDIRRLADELGVDALVEGSVHFRDGQCRLAVSVVDARSQVNLWSDGYDIPRDQLFAVQDAIAGHIVEALAPDAPTMARPATSPLAVPGAFEAYLRALYAYHKFTSADNLVAIELLETSIALDPLFAKAHALLASASLARVERGWEEDAAPWIHKADQAVAEALRLDPTISQAYSSRALIAFVKRDIAEAEADVREALGRDANNDIAHNLLGRIRSFRGEFEGAIAAFRDALRINPHYVWCLNDLAWAYWLLGREADVQHTLDRVLAISPGDEGARTGKAALLYLAHAYDEALREARRAQQTNAHYPFLLMILPPLLARANAAAEARGVCQALMSGASEDGRYIGYASSGLVEAILGNQQTARQRLASALETRTFYPALNLTYAILYADAGMDEAAGQLTRKAVHDGIRVIEAERWHSVLRRSVATYVTN